jgi:hypothetical protein
MPRHDQPLWKSGVQAPIRTHPAQLALRTILLGEVPRNLQASARPQPGLLEMALSIARAGNPEKIDLAEMHPHGGSRRQGVSMTTIQAMLIGAILAWAPSLIVFLYIVRDLRNMPSKDLD